MSRVIYKDLGRIDYPEALRVQTEAFEALLRAKASGEERSNTLFFCEHNPVLTLGKSGKESNLLVSEEYLKQLGVAYFHVNRGGDITYHGPGQIVGYPVFNLEELGLGVKAYVDAIEESIIRTMAMYGISCERLAGATGVWIEPHSSRARKICAIGVKCSRYVTMHGFALNVNTDLSYFKMINPCGFTDKGVTSMAQELGSEVDFRQVQAKLLSVMAEVFHLDIIEY